MPLEIKPPKINPEDEELILVTVLIVLGGMFAMTALLFAL